MSLQQLADKKRITRCLVIFFLLLCVFPTVLNIICLTPLYFNLNVNTLYSGGPLAVTLEYLMDFFDLISFTSVYSTVIFTLVFTEKKISTVISLSYVALLIIKIPLRILMNIPLLGSIGDKNDIIGDLLLLSFYFLLELAQFLTVLLASSFVAKSYRAAVDAIRAKKKEEPEEILPIKKMLNWYNPLLRSGIIMGIIIIAFKFLSRLVADIEAGLPSSFGEVLIIIVNYLSDAVYGLAAYFIAILIFNFLFEKIVQKGKQKENKTDENSSSALFKD